jgi:hypothetical protein
MPAVSNRSFTASLIPSPAGWTSVMKMASNRGKLMGATPPAACAPEPAMTRRAARRLA